MEVSKEQEAFKKDLATAMAKAWESESFKNELMASPRKAIESVTGRKLNIKEDVNFIVTDQSAPSTFYFNLQSKPELDNIELSEDQLELVAGGGLFDDLVSVATTIMILPAVVIATVINEIQD